MSFAQDLATLPGTLVPAEFGRFRQHLDLTWIQGNRSRLLLDGEFRPILAIEPNLPSSSSEPPGLLVEIPP